MATTVKKQAKRQSKSSSTSSRAESAAFMIRTLIGKGKTNEEIFLAMKKRGLLDESKRHWPQWYRRQMVLRGVIGKRFAEQHAHAAE
jgi:hypothetical protein